MAMNVQFRFEVVTIETTSTYEKTATLTVMAIKLTLSEIARDRIEAYWLKQRLR